ncbi:8-amino-7-oxononanoate synthase [Nocardioides gansuensis]|uniref:8-amino-7-oxononanoate synthase n=1 Tax=Nocardioides gansuensis TaxID=2138300 RepID=A0A2T8F6W7_9ACTN|nr:8-amino-7-oxononanoate synthase [Nocardioides gansuensis]PVG81439.1 8-amino-7-oxononanoate synthase [Nocardioides gansuensis]
MGSTWGEWLAGQAEAREETGLTRRLAPRTADDPAVDLAGNDYLGLSRDPAVTAAASEASLRWGAGAGASRLVTGTLSLHEELERELAAFLGHEAALVMSTGYHANLAIVTALADRDSLVVSDAHIHASLVDAARLSRAEVAVVPHDDVAAVRRALAAAGGRRALVLAESVYSVLGDAASLVDLAAVCEEHDALLVVDEAHGLGVAGVRGRGLVADVGLAGHDHVVVAATLSKSLGAQGGALLGSRALVEHLVNRARPFIFDTGLAPAATAGALAALRVLVARPELPSVVRSRVVELAGRLGVAVPAGAVLSVPMPSPQAAVAAQAALRSRGVRVGCFRPPSVPDGISRLRVTCSAGVPEAEWARATAEVLEVTGR